MHIKNQRITERRVEDSLTPKDEAVHINAWIDGLLVCCTTQQLLPKLNTVKNPGESECRYGNGITSNSRGENSSNFVDGILLTCFYGGSTSNYAAPCDTYIDFSNFRVWS